MKKLSLITYLITLGACSDSNFKGSVTSGAAPASSDAQAAEPASASPLPSEPKQASTVDSLKADCAAAAGSLKSIEQLVSYPERKGCSWGTGDQIDSVTGNLGPRNGRISAVQSSSQLIKLPAGKVCSISLASAPDAKLHYDDMLVLSIDKSAVFVSTDYLLPYMTQINDVYQWDRLAVLGKVPRDFGGRSYCIGGSAGCVIPDTDRTGPVNIDLTSDKVAPISLAIEGKKEVSMDLSAMGDNDESDCSHTSLDINVTVKYIP